MKNILQKKAIIVILTISILSATFAFALSDERWSYIQNSEVKLGVITNYGAIIGYFSEISPVKNFVNYMDAGREIQQSYYGWEDGSSWSHGDWVWNLVQGGSYLNHKPKLLEFSNIDNKIYAKSNPRNWAGCELLTDVVMEEWISLSGNVAHIIFKMTYTGPSNGPVRNQEHPAAFFDAEFTRLTYYNGPMSWTEGALTNFQPPGTSAPDRNDDIFEQWAACVNNSGWGMGVYSPETTFMGYYWVAGSGNEGNGCAHFSPLRTFAITNNFTYQYDVYLTIGMTNEIRNTFDDIRKSKFKYYPIKPLKNSEFESPVIPSGVFNEIDDWNCGGANRLLNGTVISPLAGQVAYYNGSGFLRQTLTDNFLQPDTTYQLTFDAYTTAGQPARTIYAGIMLGKNNAATAVVPGTNVENFVMSSGSWMGNNWAGGALFNTVVNPSADNPATTHTLMFDTPVSNIVGNNLTDDLTVNFWDASGIQVHLDNVRVTNYPRNRTMQPKVTNGTFDYPVIASGSTTVMDNWNNSGCGVVSSGGISPFSGQFAYFNNSLGCLQTFPGVKLQPNMNYSITFDSYSIISLRTIKVGLGHARYFSGDSRFICPIDDDNVINANQGSGTWLGSGWASGALFTNVLSPSADDPAISHIFSFTTPTTLTGDHLAFDLGVKLWGAEGAQVRLDNLIVTNYPLPEPFLTGLISLILLAFFRQCCTQKRTMI